MGGAFRGAMTGSGDNFQLGSPGLGPRNGDGMAQSAMAAAAQRADQAQVRFVSLEIGGQKCVQKTCDTPHRVNRTINRLGGVLCCCAVCSWYNSYWFSSI